MEKNSINEKLKSNTVESLLYIATMEPKTQTEAIELIYGKKNINSAPIQKARDRLVSGPEKALSLGVGISKVPLIAQIDPFLKHLQEKSKARKTSKPDRHTLTETDISYLKLVLDSDYFRETFFNNYFFEHCTGVHRGFVQRDGDKLSVPSAFGYIELVLSSIILHSQILFSDFKDLYVKDIAKIVKDCKDSNRFVAQFLNGLNDEFYGRMLDNDALNYAMEYCAIDYDPEIYQDGGYAAEDGFQFYLDRTAFSGFYLLFPPELVIKLGLLDLTAPGSSYSAACFYHMIENSRR